MPRLPVFTVADVDAVIERVWVGGALSDRHDRANEQVAELIAAGVTDVFDCRAGMDDTRAWSRASGVRYRPVGIEDDGGPIPESWFSDNVERAQAALLRADTRLLVHCQDGCNRSPSLVFALLLAEGWEPGEALRAIRTVRPVAAIRYADQALAWFGRWSGTTEPPPPS